jgi:hypothetical protein
MRQTECKVTDARWAVQVSHESSERRIGRTREAGVSGPRFVQMIGDENAVVFVAKKQKGELGLAPRAMEKAKLRRKRWRTSWMDCEWV